MQAVRKAARIVLLKLAIAISLVLSACTQPAPERSFTTMDLLIDPSDVSASWQLLFASTSKDHIGSGSHIAFLTTDSQEARADQYVYCYDSIPRAKSRYKKFFLDPVGGTPPEWEYQSLVADQFSFACYKTQGREHCEWAGRYDEYIVTFGVWLIPDRVSLEDVEQVVRAIDERMAQYLDIPSQNAGN